jgi:hypothetical protein
MIVDMWAGSSYGLRVEMRTTIPGIEWVYSESREVPIV